MVHHGDPVENVNSNATGDDFFVSNDKSQGVNASDEAHCHNGFDHNSFGESRDDAVPVMKGIDVDMQCDEVEETNQKILKSGSHCLNQPVRCLNLCGHLQ